MSRIHSLLADDPDFRDLLEMFVAELPDRVASIQTALAASDSAALRRVAHQLKGACGGYGFPTLTNDAAAIEHSIDRGIPIHQLQPIIDDFITKLNSVTAEPE